MYVKLFASLYQGTLRGRPDEILVFINMLATADRHGYVDRHFLAIAQDIGLTEEAVKAAVLALEAPDPGSRSPEFSGSRIERLDEHRAWGWHILNYQRYRDVRNSDDRREQNRAAQERFRNKRKASKQQSAHADADADVDVDVLKSTTLAANVLQKAAKRSLPAPKIGFDFKTWKFTGLDDEQFLDWQDAFPAVIVPTEVDRAASWLKANPANRKKNYARFLVAWMGRAQDRAPAQGGGAR